MLQQPRRVSLGSRPVRPPSQLADAVWWAVRALICAAALVFALRGYLFFDALIRGQDLWSGGLTRGDAILNGLPPVLVEPGILIGLALILHLIAQRHQDTRAT